MKIKYFLAGLLCVCLGTSMMTACANPQSASESAQSSKAQEVKTEKLHKLYLRVPKEFTELTAMFSCTGSGITMRTISSSPDGSPVVEINISGSTHTGGVKEQKIHFVEEKK